MTARVVYDCTMNGAVFLAYFKQVLVLNTGAGRHRRSGPKKFAGGRLLYLSAYGRDFNPVEYTLPGSSRCSAQAEKSHCHPMGTRLDRLDLFTPAESANYFEGRGQASGLNRTFFTAVLYCNSRRKSGFTSLDPFQRSKR